MDDIATMTRSQYSERLKSLREYREAAVALRGALALAIPALLEGEVLSNLCAVFNTTEWVDDEPRRL